MKIEREQLLPTAQRLVADSVAGGGRATDSVPGAVAQGADRVEISRNRARVENLKTMMRQLPDSQEEKVARIKQQMADGTYQQVAATEIAGSMLARWRELNGR